MMNKIFELIEASKIFDLSLNKLSIVIHPGLIYMLLLK